MSLDRNWPDLPRNRKIYYLFLWGVPGVEIAADYLLTKQRISAIFKSEKNKVEAETND